MGFKRFNNGGGGGSRTRVPWPFKNGVYACSSLDVFKPCSGRNTYRAETALPCLASAKQSNARRLRPLFRRPDGLASMGRRGRATLSCKCFLIREADHVRRAIYGCDAIFKEPSIISYAQPSRPEPRSNPEHPHIQIVKELRRHVSAGELVLQIGKGAKILTEARRHRGDGGTGHKPRKKRNTRRRHPKTKVSGYVALLAMTGEDTRKGRTDSIPMRLRCLSLRLRGSA